MKRVFYTFTKKNDENKASICRISSLIKLGIDDAYDESISGRFWTVNNDEATVFESDINMILKMNQYFDSINFPESRGKLRYFSKKELPDELKYYRRRQVATDMDRLLYKKGKIGTFLLRVKYRENQTWQGEALWLDVGSAFRFESMFELMRWIKECVDMTYSTERSLS